MGRDDFEHDFKFIDWVEYDNIDVDLYRSRSDMSRSDMSRLEFSDRRIEFLVKQVKELEEEPATVTEGLKISNKLKPVSAKNLATIEPPEPLWGDFFFPSCITQVNSEPGVGKTTFLYNICAHGALGGEFLGISFSRMIKTLYVDVETPSWKRTNKLKAIAGDSLPQDFYFIDSLDLREDYPHLLALCEREKYDLIVLDTQSRIFAMCEENNNSEANSYMALLRRLVNEVGCAVVLVHHTSKTERKGVYGGRGASAIAGAVDVVVSMELLEDDIIQMHVVKNRVVGDYQKLLIKKVGEDKFEPYTPPGGGSHGFEKFKAQDFILSLDNTILWQTGDILELGRRQGFNDSLMKRAVSGLVQSGKLEKVKHGVYKIVGKSSKGQKSTPREEKDELLNFSDVTNSNETNFPEYLK